jgi:hypothetical protein
MAPNLTKITEVFLLSSSFLVAALGTADTNLHKAAVSVLGLTVSLLWLSCSREAFAEIRDNQQAIALTARVQVLRWFPLIFVAGWVVSLVTHFWMAGIPLAGLGGPR